MKTIQVTQEQTCTWVLDFGEFLCSHDVVEKAEFVENYLTMQGPSQSSSFGYVCSDCGKEIDEF